MQKVHHPHREIVDTIWAALAADAAEGKSADEILGDLKVWVRQYLEKLKASWEIEIRAKNR